MSVKSSVLSRPGVRLAPWSRAPSGAISHRVHYGRYGYVGRCRATAEDEEDRKNNREHRRRDQINGRCRGGSG